MSPPHCSGGLCSALSTVRIMTICSRLGAGDGGGRSCSTRAWRVSELMVCSWSGSKGTWSPALIEGWLGSALNSWMMAGAVAMVSVAVVALEVDGTVALRLGVAGSGLGGSGVETTSLFSWDSLLWTNATG